MKNEKMTPRIRFNGFTDAWEQRKLTTMLIEKNIKEIPSKEYPLVSFTSNNGVIPKSDRYNREFLVKTSDKKYKVTEYNDIVYNPANLKFGAIARNTFGKGVFSPIYVTFRATESAGFLGLFLTTNDFIKKSLKFQEGTVYERMSVKPKDFLSQCINLPKIYEQNKIYNIFDELDKIIDFNERKHKQLMILRKLFMQKVFNISWRFKNFNIPWKQRKLSDISKITMGQSPSSKFYSDKQNNFILVQGNADLKKGKVKPRVWTSVAKKTANNNEILITVRAPVGKLAITENKVAIGRGVASINGSKLIYYLLNNLNYEKYWDKFITGSTFESINSDILKNTKLYVSLEDNENLKIVRLIESLSNLITYNEKSLFKLKKYLMQNMFI